MKNNNKLEQHELKKTSVLSRWDEAMHKLQNGKEVRIRFPVKNNEDEQTNSSIERR